MPHFLPLVVLNRVEESCDATSFELQVPHEARSQFTYSPGQYITVRSPDTVAEPLQRSYSLSSNPNFDSNLRITVKRCKAGLFSNYLCDTIQPGDLLHATPPDGTFIARSHTSRIAAFAAGSGISPIYSMVKHWLFDDQLHVRLNHVHRTFDDGIFVRALTELAKQFPERFAYVQHVTSTHGRPRQEDLTRHIEAEGMDGVYACGPEVFVDNVRAAGRVVGLEESQIHSESFFSDIGEDPAGPDHSRQRPVPLRPAESHQLTVKLSGNSHEVEWRQGVKLLDALLGEGLPAPFSCRQGICSACQCVVQSGETTMLRSDGLLPEELAQGRSLACQMLPVSKNVEVDFDV